MDSKGVYLSRIFLEFCPNPVYSILVAGKFQIYSLKITANAFVSQKLNLFFFTNAPKHNCPRGFYHYPPGRRELSIPPEKCFLKIFFPEEKGGRGLWIIPKFTKVSVTSLDRFHHLCNLYIFGLCFVVQ